MPKAVCLPSECCLRTRSAPSAFAFRPSPGSSDCERVIHEAQPPAIRAPGAFQLVHEDRLHGAAPAVSPGPERPRSVRSYGPAHRERWPRAGRIPISPRRPKLSTMIGREQAVALLEVARHGRRRTAPEHVAGQVRAASTDGRRLRRTASGTRRAEDGLRGRNGVARHPDSPAVAQPRPAARRRQIPLVPVAFGGEPLRWRFRRRGAVNRGGGHWLSKWTTNPAIAICAPISPAA